MLKVQSQQLSRPQVILANFSNNVLKKTKVQAPADSFIKNIPNTDTGLLQEFFGKMEHLSNSEKTYFENLYAIGKDKFNYIVKDKKIGTSVPYSNEKEFLDALNTMPQKEISKTYEEVNNLYKTFPKVALGYHNNVFQHQKPNITNFAQLTILKANNKRAYEYIIKNPDKQSVSNLLEIFSRKLNGSALTTLNVSQIRQIEKKGLEQKFNIEKHGKTFTEGYKAMHMYVNANELFNQRAQKSLDLNKYLSNHIVKESFNAYRGENNTEIFKSLPIDNRMSVKTRWYVLKNILKAPKDIIQYKNEKGIQCQDNLFSYILTKKDLTLSDAMQVAKYGGKKYQKQIAQIIENLKLEDNRFKSLTFDKNVAETYASDNKNTTGIFYNVHVKKGLEGMFSNVENKQAEFIINNNSKTMTFQNVHYSPENNAWNLDTTITSK